jgi:hypothetical protein
MLEATMMIAVWLLPGAHAQVQLGTDQYWQQLTANRAAQCDTQIVQLLHTIDDLKKQLEDVKKAEPPR